MTYRYDGEGNVTGITPPGKPEHSFEYDGLGQVTDYVPPAVNGSGTTWTTYSYKAQELTQITRPDGKQITYGYDAGGRLISQAQPRGNLAFSYNTTTGQLSGVTAESQLQLPRRIAERHELERPRGGQCSVYL